MKRASASQLKSKRRPHDPVHHATLADTCRDQGLLDQTAYNVLRGQVYQAVDRLPEAIGEFEEGAGLAPTLAPYYLKLAHAYRLAGREEDAITAYERMLELPQGN